MEKNNNKPRFHTLITENGKYRTYLTRKFLLRKPYKPKDSKKFLSIIPGKIKKIYIKKGDKVNTGSKLLSLEAMKMKNEILSPVDGTIKSVNIKPN
jgi:biotin carboxyl carrier protein